MNFAKSITICSVAATLLLGINYVLLTEEVNDLKQLSSAKSDIITNMHSTITSYKKITTMQNDSLTDVLHTVDKLRDMLDAPLETTLSDNLKADSFVVTAYTPYDDVSGLNHDGNPNTTATGTVPRPGTFAVDPKVIPYGSTVIIVYTDGTMERGIAEDTGGSIKGNRIDVFRYKYKTAMDFGKKTATVVWYKED